VHPSGVLREAKPFGISIDSTPCELSFWLIGRQDGGGRTALLASERHRSDTAEAGWRPARPGAKGRERNLVLLDWIGRNMSRPYGWAVASGFEKNGY
jgi:hypothetical protein